MEANMASPKGTPEDKVKVLTQRSSLRFRVSRKAFIGGHGPKRTLIPYATNKILICIKMS